jgi:hypothetical protein
VSIEESDENEMVSLTPKKNCKMSLLTLSGRRRFQ